MVRLYFWILYDTYDICTELIFSCLKGRADRAEYLGFQSECTWDSWGFSGYLECRETAGKSESRVPGPAAQCHNRSGGELSKINDPLHLNSSECLRISKGHNIQRSAGFSPQPASSRSIILNFCRRYNTNFVVIRSNNFCFGGTTSSSSIPKSPAILARKGMWLRPSTEGLSPANPEGWMWPWFYHWPPAASTALASSPMIQQIFFEEKNKHTSEQITMSDYKDERGKAVARRRKIKVGEVTRAKDENGQ